jgi:hypothetical protein
VMCIRILILKPTWLRGHKGCSTECDFGLAHRKKPLGIGQGVGCIGESIARGRQEELQFAAKHRFNVLHIVVVPEFPCGMSTVIHTLLQSPLFTMLIPEAWACDD